MEIKLVVDVLFDGKRLDLFVADYYSAFSRSTITAILKSGAILVNGRQKKSSSKVRCGDVVSGNIESSDVNALPLSESIDLDILYQDLHIIVVNKQPGMVVHPAPGNQTGTLVNALLNYFPEIDCVGNDLLRPGIVHRLDKNTSGVMVVARTDKAFHFLKKEFIHRRVEKRYLAFISGNMKEKSGRIIIPIGRHPVKRKMMSTLISNDRGRYAETLWRVIESSDGVDLVEAELKTGRTHQIRVHFKAMGHPVIGDQVYGFKKGRGARMRSKSFVGDMERAVKRQMLHAWHVSFRHPWSGRRVCFTAPVPGDMEKFMEKNPEEPVCDSSGV